MLELKHFLVDKMVGHMVGYGNIMSDRKTHGEGGAITERKKGLAKPLSWLI